MLADLVDGVTPANRARFAYLLKQVFPELGTDDDLNGANAVQRLGELYAALVGEVGADEKCGNRMEDLICCRGAGHGRPPRLGVD